MGRFSYTGPSAGKGARHTGTSQPAPLPASPAARTATQDGLARDDNFWPLTAGLASLPEPLPDGDNVTPEHRGHINHPGPRDGKRHPGRPAAA